MRCGLRSDLCGYLALGEGEMGDFACRTQENADVLRWVPACNRCSR